MPPRYAHLVSSRWVTCEALGRAVSSPNWTPDVIKVEPLCLDAGRLRPAYRGDRSALTDRLHFLFRNAGKRGGQSSICNDAGAGGASATSARTPTS